VEDLAARRLDRLLAALSRKRERCAPRNVRIRFDVGRSPSTSLD
jgi:hypothetical protein